jgi:hypothetical protein
MLDHNEKQPENRIGGLIRLAYTKAKQRDLTPLPPLQDEIGQALSPEVYEQLFLNEASYLVNKDFLGRELLQEQLRHLRAADYRLKLELPANYTLTLGVFPSTDVGRTLTEEEIKRGQYWHSLIGRSGLPTASTFCLLPGPFEQVLPERLRQLCSLSLSYGNGEQHFLLGEDYNRLRDFYIASFSHWRQFFGLPPLNDLP